MKDHIGWKTKTTLLRFQDLDGEVAKKSRAGATLEELTKEFKDMARGPPDIHLGNVACNAGIQVLEDLLIASGSPTSYAHANAYIGAGDGNGSVPTPAATDTALAAPTNKAWVEMDETYPSRSSQKLTFRSTFAAGTGTWYWRELGIMNGNGSGALLNHLAYDKGSKAAGDTFIPTIEITIS